MRYSCIMIYLQDLLISGCLSGFWLVASIVLAAQIGAISESVEVKEADLSFTSIEAALVSFIVNLPRFLNNLPASDEFMCSQHFALVKPVYKGHSKDLLNVDSLNMWPAVYGLAEVAFIHRLALIWR